MASDNFSIDDLAKFYRIQIDNITCDQCRFCNDFTIDVDHQMCFCVYWGKHMNCKTHCDHYMPKVRI